MNWKNLKNNNCPQCNCYLVEREGKHKCSSQICNFSIGNEKFEKIINNLYKKPEYKDEYANLSDLNNFGHSFNPEGFLQDETEYE